MIGTPWHTDATRVNRRRIENLLIGDTVVIGQKYAVVRLKGGCRPGRAAVIVTCAGSQKVTGRSWQEVVEKVLEVIDAQ